MNYPAELLISIIGDHYGCGITVEYNTELRYDMEELFTVLDIYNRDGSNEAGLEAGCEDRDHFRNVVELLLSNRHENLGGDDRLDWGVILICFGVFVQTVTRMRAAGIRDSYGQQIELRQVFQDWQVTEWVRSRPTGWYELFQYISNATAATNKCE